MTGTPSTLYTLGVRLKVQPDGLGPLLTRLREITQYGSRAEKAIERIGTAARKASTSSAGGMGELRLALVNIQHESLNVARAAGLTTSRYREATSAVRALRNEVSHIPKRIPTTQAQPQSRRSSSFGGDRYINDLAGTFIGFFGGGVAANLGGAIGGMVGGPVGAMAGQALGGVLGAGASATTGALGSVTRATIDLGREAEMTRASLAGLYQSISGVDAETASRMGASTYRQLRADAAKGVGGLSDYTRAYGELYTPLAQGGASLDQIRSLTRLSLGQGFALRGREGMQLAPLDIVQALTSGVSERQTPFAMAAIRSAGMKPDGFNQLTIQEKIATLVKGFESFGPAVERIGRTFEAQADTLADNQRQIGQKLTAAAFETARGGLFDLNETIAKNKSNLDLLAVAAGSVVQAFAAAGASLLGMAARFGMGTTRAAGGWAYAGDASSKLIEQFGAGSSTSALDWMGMQASKAAAGGLENAQRLAATAVLSARAAFIPRRSAYMPGLPGAVEDYGKEFSRIWRREIPQSALTDPDDPLGDALREQQRVLDELNKQLAASRNVTIRMEAPVRVEWGNDRGTARSLETVLLSVAEQAAVARTVPVGGVFALSGGA